MCQCGHVLLQVTWERAKRNFDLWYGGVPRTVLEAPFRQRKETEDQAEAKAAISGISIDEVRPLTTCRGHSGFCESWLQLPKVSGYH